MTDTDSPRRRQHHSCRHCNRCNAFTLQTVIWYLNNNALIGGGYGATLPSVWNLTGVADL